jgi:hypothetical protein
LKLDDGSTTGKFGRGFNSVSVLQNAEVNLTDLTGLQLDRLAVYRITGAIPHT